MSDLTNNPICLVLASLIADDIAELIDAHHDWDYALDRQRHYRKTCDGFAPEYIEEWNAKALNRVLDVERKLASIGINVQEAHNRLKAKQEDLRPVVTEEQLFRGTAA